MNEEENVMSQMRAGVVAGMEQGVLQMTVEGRWQGTHRWQCVECR